MKTKKKDYVVLYTLLGLYLVGVIVYFGINEYLKYKEKQNEKILFIGFNIKFQYKDKIWSDITDISELNLNNYDVYSNNAKLGKYNLQYFKDKWYVFDKNKNPIKYDGMFIAIKSNKDLNFPEYKINELNNSDLKYLEELLNDKIENYDINMNQKIVLDFDNDGSNETLYAVSNTFKEDQPKYFAFLYLVDENETKIIQKVIKNSSKHYYMPLMGIVSIVDIDDDNKYEIIVDESYFNNIRPCHSMYQYDGKVNVLKACEEE